ncbi:Protein transport protein Sec24C [Babesia bigemina]|uniref:Protein transport protein Sec24C n=1 Tax=Babesia bigemina TaxID=5866 RepID=A0A061DA18_BABBI|nr:Protein transport protein Sec24C [Babesia bigemina]CDR95754.1 Protein transport protein Sec24C [Babesia bigemina]|eukprot:XP_012767940.1 Protein transport protein Sec24C [Babesia bigemina]
MNPQGSRVDGPPPMGAADAKSPGASDNPQPPQVIRKIPTSEVMSVRVAMQDVPTAAVGGVGKHPGHHQHHVRKPAAPPPPPAKDQNTVAPPSGEPVKANPPEMVTRRRTSSDVSMASRLRSGSESYYIDRELEKVVFPYGAHTPKKTDYAKLPRPVSNIAEVNDEIGVDQISPMKSFLGQQAADVSVCSERFLSTTLREIPLFGETLGRIKIPLAAVVQPFAEEVDGKVPLVDLVSAIGEESLSKQNLIRCPRCQAYFNPAMEDDYRLNYRLCNFCYNGFMLSEAESNALTALKGRDLDNARVAPIMHGSVDFVAPLRYYVRDLGEDVTIAKQLTSLLSRASELTSMIPLLNNPMSPKKDVVYSTYDVKDLSQQFEGMGPTGHPHHEHLGGAADEPSSEAAAGAPAVSVLQTPASVPSAPQWKKDIVRKPAYVIVVDATANSAKMGLRNAVLQSMRSVFEECAASRTPVKFCVITFDSVVHLYSRRRGFFQVNVVYEVWDHFSPSCADELFIEFDGTNLEDVNSYLDGISRLEVPANASSSCGNFALSVGVSLLAEANTPGTVCIFYSQPPEMGLGYCHNPTVSSDFSMEESLKMFYDGIIQQCYESGIAVDVYLCASFERMPGDVCLQYVSQQTAGIGCSFPAFEAVSDAPKIVKNLVRLFSLPHAYNCELKLRCSKPIEVEESYCPFHNTRAFIDKATLRVPRLSPDTAICFALGMDDLIRDRERLFVQFACMYNSSVDGRKLVRVHTQSMKASTRVNAIIKGARCDTLVNYYARKMAYNMIRSGTDARKSIKEEVVAMLCSYRQLCAPSTPENQLILPENLQNLPAALNALFKMYNPGELVYDYLQKMLRTLLAPTGESKYSYTRCYCLHRSVYDEYAEGVPEGGWGFACLAVPSSATEIYSDGLYLIDDGHKLVLYFGPHVRWALLQELFGKDLLLNETTANTLSISSETETGRNLLDVISRVRALHVGGQFLHLKILPYCSRYRRLLKLLMLEDEAGGEANYEDFLVTMHRQIKLLQSYRVA